MSTHRVNLGIRVTATLVLVLAWPALGLMAQQTTSGATQSVPALSPPFKTVTFSPIPRNQATAPFFSHGYFIQFKRRATSAGESNIFLFDSYGQFAHELAIWPDGATSMFLTSVDVGANGRLAFAGQAKLETGRLFLFIATSDLDGTNPRYFETGNYRASQIAVADNGSIWAIGAERAEISKDQAAGAMVRRWQNYDMLRNYSPAGALLEQFLPRWEARVAYATSTTDGARHTIFASYDSAGKVLPKDFQQVRGGYRDAWNAVTRQTYLRSSGPNTVIYDGLNSRICRHNAAANTFVCETVIGPYMTSESMTGLALTGGGDVLVSLKTNGLDSDSLCGLFQLTPKDSDKFWQWGEVPGTKAFCSVDGGFFSLLGSDEDSLVYSRMNGGADRKVYESTRLGLTH